MKIPKEIARIEKQLAAKKIPLSRVFTAADIDRSTWSRWRSGDTLPRIDRWIAVVAAVTSLTSIDWKRAS